MVSYAYSGLTTPISYTAMLSPRVLRLPQEEAGEAGLLTTAPELQSEQ